MKNKLRIPRFKNESAERNFWQKTDLAKYFDKEDFEQVSFPDLKPTSQSVSIRIPAYLLIRIKERANEMDIPYQSLIKRCISQLAVKNK